MQENVKEEHFFQDDFYFNKDEYIHYISINKVKSNGKNDLIMVHGYGGGCFNFFKCCQYLQDHFRIIILDLPGMGLNSRNAFIKNFKKH